MAETVKMCDMTLSIAANVFEMLNRGRVRMMLDDNCKEYIVTDVEPKDLIYPEGWYYAKGCFRNTNLSSTEDNHCEVEMRTSDSKGWYERAKYCTLHDNKFRVRP